MTSFFVFWFLSGWVYLGIVSLQWGFTCMSSWAVSVMESWTFIAPRKAFQASLLLALNPWQPSVSSVEHHPDALYRMLPFVSSCIRHNSCDPSVGQSWLANASSLLSQTKQNKTKDSQPWLGRFGGYCSVIIATTYTKPHKPRGKVLTIQPRVLFSQYQPAPAHAEFLFQSGTLT